MFFHVPPYTLFLVMFSISNKANKCLHNSNVEPHWKAECKSYYTSDQTTIQFTKHICELRWTWMEERLSENILWHAHTCLILVWRKNHVIVSKTKNNKQKKCNAECFYAWTQSGKRARQIRYVCQYWWSIYVSLFSLFSLHTQTQTHTNINRIAAINHIQWVIYIYMHCLWFKSSSYDVNVDVDVVESCSSRFFPQLNLMLMFHFTFMHSLLCMHVCVCVEYVYLYFISWLHIFFYYLLV